MELAIIISFGSLVVSGITWYMSNKIAEVMDVHEETLNGLIATRVHKDDFEQRDKELRRDVGWNYERIRTIEAELNHLKNTQKQISETLLAEITDLKGTPVVADVPLKKPNRKATLDRKMTKPITKRGKEK